ncbi:hypothetical protein [Tateyamaria sp.]|uniref:hypothetical protein n=1 Tax=Tateyamaria sp. TaxID=1929288 RepID=UPI00327F6F0F
MLGRPATSRPQMPGVHFSLAMAARRSYTALSLQIPFAAQPLVSDPQGDLIAL